jgi:filamentous hemagglutinin
MPGQGLSAALSGAGMGKDSGSTSSTTTAGISGIAGDTAKRTGDNAQGIGKIFDADKVRQEIQAQTKITQKFSKQASTAIASYSDQQKKDLQAQIKAAPDTDKAALKQQLDQVLLEEKILNILVGAVTGFGETMVTKESLATAAEQMRAAVAEDSGKFRGVVDKDGKLLFSNQSGDSVGVDGDGKKYAGTTRADLDRLCGADNSRCAKNSDGSLALTDKGQVEFIGAKKTDGTFQTYAEFLQSEDGKKMTSAPFGGQQGSERTWLFGEYPKGGIVDKLLETFAGPHDTIGGKWSGLYDDLGNTTRGRSDAVKVTHEVWSGVALVPAAPFAAAKELPPEVWKAIDILLKAGQ